MCQEIYQQFFVGLGLLGVGGVLWYWCIAERLPLDQQDYRDEI